MKSHKLIFLIAVATACFLLPFKAHAVALILDVDRNDDAIDAAATACTSAPNDCSLRGAIIKANGHAGADTINLPANTYTLTLTGIDEDASAGGDLDITDSLTINGAGAKTTVIDGNATDRVLDISPTLAAITVTVNDLAVVNGFAKGTAQDGYGGGIKIEAGTTHLNRVAIENNRSTSFGLGGGVMISGASTAVTIDRSTIDGNSTVDGDDAPTSPDPSGAGGGFYVDGGTVAITNSTIAKNHTGKGGDATSSAGAHGGQGGGIFIDGGTLTLNNDTITRNAAGAGGSGTNFGADGNGGGIAITGTGTVQMRNTILAQNTVAANGAGPDCDGNIASQGANIISALNVCTGFDTNNADHFSADPLLDPDGLQDNGGKTKTIALLEGSVAIDKGDDAHCAATDERGLVRPQGVHCDIGAFEKGSCGDGFLEPEEQCDDGNNANNDGCDATCVTEASATGGTTGGDTTGGATGGETTSGATTSGNSTGGSSGSSGGCSLIR